MKWLPTSRTPWLQAAVLLAVFALRWPLLQLIAWLSMLVRYSSQHGLVSGWRMTFDGEHPCVLCRAVATGSQAEAAVLGLLASQPALLLLPASLVVIALPWARRLQPLARA